MADKTKTVNPIQVQKYLGGINYPASKKELLDTAKKKGADQNVMDTLNKLPDRSYDAPTDVTKAIGKLS